MKQRCKLSMPHPRFGTWWLIGVALSLPVSVEAQPTVAYSVNAQESSLSIYDVRDDGTLRYRRHHVLPKAPSSVLLHPNHRFLYALAKASDQIAIYRVAADSGDITEIPGSPVTINARSPFDLAFHPNGEFLYVAARFSGVAALRVNGATGAIEELAGSPFPAQERTRSLAVHPSGRFLYATNAYSNSVSVFTIEQQSGRLLPQPDLTVSSGQQQPAPRQALRLQDMPALGGGVPYQIVVHPGGRYAFVSNWAGASISVFMINAEDGALRLLHGKPVATGLNPYALAVHPSGKYIYVGYWGDNKVAGYRFDETDGGLRELPGSPFDSAGTAPVAIRCTDADHCYVVNSWSNSITLLQVRSDGTLVPHNTTQTRSGPVQLAFGPAAEQSVPREDVLLLTAGGGTVAWWHGSRPEQFSVVPGVPVFDDLAVFPEAGLVYLIPRSEPALRAYRMSPDAGTWETLADIGMDQQPTALLADRRAGFLYVYDANGAITAYALDAATGTLHQSQYSLQPGIGVVASALDAASRYLFTAGGTPPLLRLFRYGDAWGPVMSDMTLYGPPVALLARPTALLTDPSANFLLVGTGAPNRISVYRHHFQSGLLDDTTVRQQALTGEPRALAMNDAGDTLGVVTGSPNTLVSYRFHNLDGRLERLTTLPLSGVPKGVQAGAQGLYVLLAGEIQVYMPEAVTGTMSLRQRLPLAFEVNHIELLPVGR